MEEDRWEVIEAKARQDVDGDRFFALRKLVALPERHPVTVGIVGPYDIDPTETMFFAYVSWPGNRMLVPSQGDRFQAISLAVEFCRAHLVLLMKIFPEGLLDTLGGYYQNYDLPSEPVAPPPLDFERVLKYRNFEL